MRTNIDGIMKRAPYLAPRAPCWHWVCAQVQKWGCPILVRSVPGITLQIPRFDSCVARSQREAYVVLVCSNAGARSPIIKDSRLSPTT